MPTDQDLPGAPSPSGDGPTRARLPREPGGRRRVTKVLMTEAEYTFVSAKAAAQGVSVPRLLVESAANDAPTATERRAFYAELLAVRRQLAHITDALARIGDGPSGHDPATLTNLTTRLAASLDRLDSTGTGPAA
ncbi:plasmid mobilization protein [Embleya sp. NPDC020630]|uniref:plasmid mobilization protein n=1 Tax=Embleya sp. NPDC020630 TaxID=3363979 RepID=UPI0037BA1D57